MYLNNYQNEKLKEMLIYNKNKDHDRDLAHVKNEIFKFSINNIIYSINYTK
jgi:hypothetical protein